MTPADLGFILTAQHSHTTRATEYCVYGDKYQLTRLYFDLLQLAEKCPPSQKGIWIGDLEAYHVNFDEEHVKTVLKSYQDSFWHFIFTNTKDIKFVRLVSDDEDEYGLYFATVGYGFSGYKMLRDLFDLYYNKLWIAYKDHIVISGSSITTVEDWEKKYFA